MLRKPIIIIAAVAALVVASVSVYAISNNNSLNPLSEPQYQVRQEVVPSQEPAPQPEVQEPPVQPQQEEIGLEEAKRIALAQVPGASSSDIVKAHQDYDDGIIEYEIQINYNGYEYEYEIHGVSGNIISKDVDHIEWDDRYDD